MGGILDNIHNNVSFALAMHTKELARLQEQVSTGSCVNRTSDDSSAAYQILGLDSQQKMLCTFIDNISSVISTLEYSSTIIQEISTSFTQVKTLITQVINGTYTEEARERTADGINDILEQIVSLANSNYMGQYLFGGSNTSSPPYQVQRTNGTITDVTYCGSYDSRQIEIIKGLKSSASQIGDNIFRANDRSDPVFLGETGAKAGTGTSSVKGDIWLTVTGSAGNYTLSIDDGLSTFTTDGTDTNLMVTNSLTGEVLYVDTTEITQTGVDVVRVPGTYDIFGSLISIRDLLYNSRGLPESQLNSLQETTLSSLTEVSSLIAQVETSIGSKISFLDNIRTSMENMKYNSEDHISSLQDADVTQIAIDISLTEILYEMSLSVAGKLLSVSLFDFIG